MFILPNILSIVLYRLYVSCHQEATIILPAQQIGAAVAPWPSGMTSIDDMAHKGKGNAAKW